MLSAIQTPEDALRLLGCARGKSVWSGCGKDVGATLNVVELLFAHILRYAVQHTHRGADGVGAKGQWEGVMVYDDCIGGAIVGVLYKLQCALCIAKRPETFTAYLKLYLKSSMALLENMRGTLSRSPRTKEGGGEGVLHKIFHVFCCDRMSRRH